MSIKKNRKLDTEQVKREGLTDLENIHNIEQSISTLQYYEVDVDDEERITSCPRGASWQCSQCYLTMIRKPSERVEQVETWICTPYTTFGDLRLSAYNYEDTKRYGMFVLDYLVFDIGENPTISQYDLDEVYNQVHYHILKAGTKSELN